jgi:amidohydrolase
MSEGLADRIRIFAEELNQKLRDTRRQIHRQPELGFQEQETAALVVKRLRELGLEVYENIGQTGVMGLLRGRRSGKTVALRADMDALPLQEQTTSTDKSQVHGVMHACGHDAHVACLLGAAEILAHLDTKMPGTVKFLFQPSEEDLPSGARAMIDAGVLDSPPVDVLVALHVDPETPAGGIGLRTGPFLAEARDFAVQILGRAGHGAHPHQAIDAIVTAAHFVTQLQTLVSRRVDPLKSAVISVGEIRGGQADNIVADKVELRGTVRCLDTQLADALVRAVEGVLRGVTTAAGAKGEIQWTQGCAVLVNDESVTEAVRSAAIQLYGPEALHENIPQSMGGDDFAFFLQRVPGALFVLGTNDGTERTSYPLHHPRFDIDESAMVRGAAILALTAYTILSDG